MKNIVLHLNEKTKPTEGDMIVFENNEYIIKKKEEIFKPYIDKIKEMQKIIDLCQQNIENLNDNIKYFAKILLKDKGIE